MNIYSPAHAWEAYESRNYPQAAQIWLLLLAAAENVTVNSLCQAGYCAVLMAQKQFQQALAICEEMYEITRQSAWLHQLGCICKEMGRLDTARGHFLAEQTWLALSEPLAMALNAYQLAALAFLQDKIPLAFHYVRVSLEYARKSANHLAESYAYQLLGAIRQNMRDPEKAQDCYDSAQLAASRAPVNALQHTGDIRLAALLLRPLQAHTQA